MPKKKEKTLREKIADLEHQQWMSWTKHIAGDVLEKYDLELKWQKNWKPYSELAEEEKEKDRIWADKILELVVEEKRKAYNDGYTDGFRQGQLEPVEH